MKSILPSNNSLTEIKINKYYIIKRSNKFFEIYDILTYKLIKSFVYLSYSVINSFNMIDINDLYIIEQNR